MKKLVALLVFALAATAFAGDTAWYNTDTQTLQWQRPARVTVNGTDYGPNPHPDLVVAAGWQSLALDCAWTDTVTDWEESPPVRCMTQKEIDAKAEAEAAEIALIGPDPETFVPILDADGEPVGTARLIVDSDTMELVAVINSESPQRTWAEQKADFMAARAAAAAAAEAAASLPLQSATGFAVQDSDGHWVELEPTGDGLPVIGVQVSNSPLTPEERAAMKAERKAAHDALKAAAQDKKLNDKDKIALLMKAVFGVEE